MLTYEECRNHKIYGAIKQTTIETINDYVTHGLPAGSFCEAVLSNDLKNAFGQADKENRRTLFEIVSYCYNEIPSACWGNEAIIHEWIKKGGLNGNT